MNYPLNRIILINGENGSYYKDKDSFFFASANKVKTVDATAAGDIFVGFSLVQ